MQVVQVHLQPFWCNSLLKQVSQLEIATKFTKKHYYGGSRSFKVIVDKNKKNVTIACLCLSATVFTLHEIIAVK